MNDDKKAIEQALQAAAMELKAKGAAANPEAEAAPEAQTAEPEQVTEPAAEPQQEKKPEKEKKDKSKPSKSAGKKQSADALKEIAKVRRNKIIGITAAVLAVMVFIFLIARDGGNKVDHGGAPTVMEDGSKVYPDGTTEQADGTVIDADGTVHQPDGTVIAPDGTVTKPDGTVTKPDGSAAVPEPVTPGDTNISNVQTDTGEKPEAPELPWNTMTDGDYQVSIRRLNPYSGPFLEDGQDEEVTNILALQFRNDGEQDIQYAEYVYDINGEEVAFKLSNLPAGQSCVVLAANKHAYNADEVLKITSRLVARVEVLPTADDQLLLVNNGDDTVSILNMTDQPIPVARVFYKTYYAEQDTFIGGITYSIEIRNIPANGSTGALSPSHFSSEMSRFVGSGVYDE